MSDFAHIRIIAKRQVLAYTQADNDEISVVVMYRLKNGTNVQMKLGFEDEQRMEDNFAKITAGVMDASIAKTIAEHEKNFNAMEPPTVTARGGREGMTT